MYKASFRFTVTAIVLLSVLLLQPMTLGAQCMVTMTVTMTSGTMTFVSKYLSGVNLCQSTMMNAATCLPGAPKSVSILFASAMSTAVSPSCAWSCACGPVTIDGSDGLLVELMGFEIEGEPGPEADS